MPKDSPLPAGEVDRVAKFRERDEGVGSLPIIPTNPQNQAAYSKSNSSSVVKLPSLSISPNWFRLKSTAL